MKSQIIEHMKGKIDELTEYYKNLTFSDELKDVQTQFEEIPEEFYGSSQYKSVENALTFAKCFNDEMEPTLRISGLHQITVVRRALCKMNSIIQPDLVDVLDKILVRLFDLDKHSGFMLEYIKKIMAYYIKSDGSDYEKYKQLVLVDVNSLLESDGKWMPNANQLYVENFCDGIEPIYICTLGTYHYLVPIDVLIKCDLGPEQTEVIKNYIKKMISSI